LRLLGEISFRRTPQHSDQAETHFEQALVLSEQLGMEPLRAHCLLGLGTVYEQRGQWQQARTSLSAARALYREMGMTFWLPQAETALERLIAAGRSDTRA
jgi:uncharacterized protein HemY